MQDPSSGDASDFSALGRWPQAYTSMLLLPLFCLFGMMKPELIEVPPSLSNMYTPSAERETENLLRTIKQSTSPVRKSEEKSGRKVFYKRKRSKKKGGRKKKLIHQSASEPVLRGPLGDELPETANSQPSSYFQDDRQREAPLRDLSFSAEETRVRQVQFMS
jgi:hypothetical protein